MPDTPAVQKKFSQPKEEKPGCRFAAAHLLVLCDAASERLLEILISPRRGRLPVQQHLCNATASVDQAWPFVAGPGSV
jgi:hypothetical protein